jgi:hypothetical protein
MKMTRTKIILATAFALANGFFAAAQSNNNVPGPEDYARFSPFITERNIFDPNRYPRYSRNSTRTYRPTRANRSAPTFALVGTMSYTKGMFAFFDGNNSDLRKVLSQSGTIAGYTVTEVTATGVTLQSADKKQTLQLKIGDSMRQEGTAWRLAGSGESFSTSSSSESESSAGGESSSPAADTAPSPALEGNDVLKKLMQQREQEMK